MPARAAGRHLDLLRPLQQLLIARRMDYSLVAAVALAAAAVFAVTRNRDAEGPLTDKVTILFTDTNEKIEMRRGELEMKLLERAGPVDAAG